MRKSTVTVPATSTLQTMKMQGKARPFGAYFTTRLEGVNSKLVCALSTPCTTLFCGGGGGGGGGTCRDD
jgi:hypothetical protein